MDTVHSLLRTVVRNFYDLKAIILLDSLLQHHVLSDRDLVTITGITMKDIRATCAKLRDDHLIKEVSHKDDTGMRAYTQTVYYIHFTEAVDAVKFKMHLVESKLKEELNHKHNAQDYVCARCQSHFETIDALALFDPVSQEFNCGFCGAPLKEEVRETNLNLNSHMEEFMTQMRPILTLLKQIDEVSIPENSIDSELQLHVPLVNNDIPGLEQPKTEIESDFGKAVGIAVAGSSESRLPQQQMASFNVNITSEEEQESLRLKALEEKKKHLEENQLPSWHTSSAVDPVGKSLVEDVVEEVKVKVDGKAETEMDEYFKKLREEREEEEEEEEEFEDIV